VNCGSQCGLAHGGRQAAFGRSKAGLVRGDQDIADRYLNLFFRI
jgi:hypothetical protein